MSTTVSFVHPFLDYGSDTCVGMMLIYSQPQVTWSLLRKVCALVHKIYRIINIYNFVLKIFIFFVRYVLWYTDGKHII